MTLYSFIVIKNFESIKVYEQILVKINKQMVDTEMETEVEATPENKVDFNSISVKLEEYFNDPSKYTDPDLTIHKLAKELNIGVNSLSLRCQKIDNR